MSFYLVLSVALGALCTFRVCRNCCAIVPTSSASTDSHSPSPFHIYFLLFLSDLFYSFFKSKYNNKKNLFDATLLCCFLLHKRNKSQASKEKMLQIASENVGVIFMEICSRFYWWRNFAQCTMHIPITKRWSSFFLSQHDLSKRWTNSSSDGLRTRERSEQGFISLKWSIGIFSFHFIAFNDKKSQVSK